MTSQNLKFRRHYLIIRSDCSLPPLCKAQTVKYYIYPSTELSNWGRLHYCSSPEINYPCTKRT